MINAAGLSTWWTVAALTLLVLYVPMLRADVIRADQCMRELPAGVVVLDGRIAPDLRLAVGEGRPLDLANLRGQWVMVHFWASWCAPCRREMPAIAQVRPVLASTKVRLVMVNTAETEDEVFAFMSLVAPELDTLLDRDGQVTEDWQPRGLPASFFVDPDGRLRFIALGGRDWDSAPYTKFLQNLSHCYRTGPQLNAPLFVP